MATLYRKYRPQNFAEIFGQNHIKITLEHEIAAGKIAHAYLFCGPRAIGKTTIARVFSKAVNCLDRTEGKHEPCNKCESCNEINLGRSLDIIEIDAASHTGVDNVRENIISVSRLAPSKRKYKIFIIDEVHMLSASAFNALLKTLEEPPETVIFILCTTEVHKIPATIISRCQRFDFKRISIPEIVKKLEYVAKGEGIKIDNKILEAIAQQSEGHMRDAESLLGQVISIGGKEITQEEADLVVPRSDLNEVIKLITCLAKKDASAGIGLVNKLIDEGADLKRFTSDLVELLRKIMITKINPVLAEKLSLELGESAEVEIKKISQNLSLVQLITAIEKFVSAKQALKSSFIIQLPLEVAIIELCTEVAVPTVTKTAPAPNRFTPPGMINRPSAPANSAPATPSTTTPPVNTGKVQIKKEEIENKWNDVLVKVKKYNHSLSFILRVCEPREVSGNQLCLAFKYKFHKERIGDVNIKQIVEKVLQEVYGLPLAIEAIVDESLEVNGNGLGAPAPVENNPVTPEKVPAPTENESTPAGASNSQNDKGMIDNLLKTFGGKVVE